MAASSSSSTVVLTDVNKDGMANEDQWKQKKVVIGIDLGTTYSVVAVYQNGNVEIIENDDGERTTPSVVSFDNSERLVGKSAKQSLEVNPLNTIYDTKRIIGLSFDDLTISADISKWPFNITKGSKEEIVYEVNFKNEQTMIKPIQISSYILGALKLAAERYLKCEIHDAVITVLAYFTEPQRQATKDAGTIAGLNVRHIINEPTAAALAYTFKHQLKKSENTILVYDLGGGTFDVSIVRVLNRTSFTVLATAGDTHLGGIDIDRRIQTHLAEEFKSIHEIDLSSNSIAMARLLIESESAKKQLSLRLEVPIIIHNLHGNINFKTKMSRSEMEAVCGDLLENTIDYVDKALGNASMKKSEINEVLLVGGSTRIPKVIEILKEHFPNAVISSQINADEAVAYGAAINAAMMSGAFQDDPKIQQLVLTDITPLSLGVRLRGGKMRRLIPINSRIPCAREEEFRTCVDNQTEVEILIYEGEVAYVEENQLIGSLQLSDIPPAPAGEAKILIQFRIDRDGILNVTAFNNASEEASLNIQCNITTRPEEEELNRLIHEGVMDYNEAIEKQKLLEIRDKITKCLASTLKKSKQFQNTKNKEKFNKKHELVSSWYKNSQTNANFSDLQLCLSDLESFFEKLKSKDDLNQIDDDEIDDDEKINVEPDQKKPRLSLTASTTTTDDDDTTTTTGDRL